MGVYIDMEMPTTPVLFCVHPDGKVFADLEGEWREYTAVPVKPHGRLMDADDFFRSFPELLPYEFAAPTILEAEEAET